MPKLKKVRLINFKYNDRHYIDDIFDLDELLDIEDLE